MRRLLLIIICLLLVGTVGAAWKHTPYKVGFNGNIYYGTSHYTAAWLAKHMSYMVSGLADFPQLADSLLDSCRAQGYPFWAGFYASSQEMNRYVKSHPEYGYTNRTDTASYWLDIYAQHYMDSVGQPCSLLYVHDGDDMVACSLKAEAGHRVKLTAGLTEIQLRHVYQYWNNAVGDTTWPNGGYSWLANGYNTHSRAAIAYAFRRRLIEDSLVLVGMGGHMPTCYYMDNQYRDGARLGSYIILDSTRGGPTTSLDWIEQPGIGIAESSYVYHDSSIMPIDTMIKHVMDSVTTANSLPKIMQIANITKTNTTHLGKTLPFVGAVELENVAGYTENVSNWRAWYAYADTMSKHMDKYILWGQRYDFICGVSGWKADTSRMFMAAWAFYLTVQDTNAFSWIMRFNDTTRWRDIAEVDLGTPDSLAKFIDTTGNRDYVRDVGTYPNDSTYIYTVRRYYNNSNAVVIFITSTTGRWGTHTLDNISESLDVDLGGYYYPISADGDTAGSTVNTVRLPIYSGFIGISGEAPTVPTISRTPATFTFTATEGGSNPANQTLSISNSGAGTLDWALTDDAAWLSEGTTSGENTGSSTVIVDIAGLSPGDYNATITITDVDATNNPQTATVALHVDAAEVDIGQKKIPWLRP